MRELEITSDDFYWIANCCTHNLNLAASVPTEKVLGLGGLGRVNALQLCHSIWDLANHFGQAVWCEMMREEMLLLHIPSEPPSKMPQPVTT